MSPVDSEEDLIACIVEASATWHYSAHTSVSATSSSALYRGWWPYICTSALNWYEIQFFFNNTSVVLLDIRPYSDPTWRSVALQGRISDIYSLTVNLVFIPPITSQSLGQEFSYILYIHSPVLWCVINYKNNFYLYISCHFILPWSESVGNSVLSKWILFPAGMVHVWLVTLSCRFAIDHNAVHLRIPTCGLSLLL